MYLQNRLPTSDVDGITPVEAWNCIRHLKVFGSLCYTHISTVKQSKLDKKAEKGIFVCYNSISKGYRIYNIESGKDFVRRDLQYRIDAYWNSNISQVRRMDVEPALEDSNEDLEVENDKDFFVRGTRPLAEICGRCNLVFPKPSNFQDAGGIEEWMREMKEEIAMIENNKTWKLIDKLETKQVDEESYCDLNVYQVRRMDIEPSLEDSNKDLEAKNDEDFYVRDSSAPVARMDAIRILIALAAQMKWKIYHLDDKSAFQNGFLEEEIYLAQPEAYKRRKFFAKIEKGILVGYSCIFMGNRIYNIESEKVFVTRDVKVDEVGLEYLSSQKDVC
ncbi:uncharacterized protein [Solanum tuberosum]|uniref:uncharacterized protein n=1 Tax=Solanum tuberosum TaxID=4113 RepID=UPI00073A3D35|nr:PREDICTED: uncharacterized protein LOC107060175 [Solanum tuberosum]